MTVAEEALVRKYGQRIPIEELRRLQAIKRGVIPAPPPEPGVPRRIPEYEAPTEPQVKKMRDQLMMLERQIKRSPFDKWKLEDGRVISRSEVLHALQENKHLIRNFLAQRDILEKNLASLSKVCHEGKCYRAYIEKGRTVIVPPPGISPEEHIRNLIKYSPPWVQFKTADGRVISRNEAYELIVKPEEEIIARVEEIKDQIRTGDIVELAKYLGWSFGLLGSGKYGEVIGDWIATTAGWKTAEEHIRKQVEIEKVTAEELKTKEGRLGLVLRHGLFLGVPFVAGKAIGVGVGYITGLKPTLAPAVKYGMRVAGAYIAGTEAAEITSLMQAGKYEAAASRGTELGIQAYIGIRAFGPAYRTGLIAGYRKRVLIQAETAAERTRVNTIFKQFEAIEKIPAGTKTVVRIMDVENLSADGKLRLIKFLKSPEAKKFHIILGGSLANPVPGRMPHDVDIAIGKYRIPRPRFKGLGFERWETSRVAKFKTVLGKHLSKEDIGTMDIKDAEKVGAIFAYKGKVELAAARVRKPVRVKGERYYRVSLKEQLERKLAAMLSPAHEGRGKDWDDFIALFKAKIDSDLAAKLITPKQYKSYNTLLTKITKWKPTIKDGKLIAPAKPPPGLEIEVATRFEKILRERVESPVFVTKTQEMQKFVPQMVKNKYTKEPLLKRILMHIIGVDNTSKVLNFLKEPEGDKLLASFGMIPERKPGLYKTPFFVPPFMPPAEPPVKPTPYVTPISKPYKPIIAPPITPAIEPPIIAPPVRKPVIAPPFITPIIKPVKPIKPVPTVYRPPLIPRRKPVRKIEQGYDAWAKKYATKPKRQWVKLSDKPLKEKQALGMGAKAVDESVARTFKIKKTKKPPVSKPHLANVWYQKQHKFRKPIKAGKVQHKSPLWIEKSKHLIDSPGEFRGITVEGWKAIQAKKRERMFMYTGPPKRRKK